MNLVPLILGSAALAYVCAVLLLWVLQDRFIYFPRHTLFDNPSGRGLAFEDVELRTADGISIHAWYVPSADDDRAILFCHGNGGNVAHALDAIAAFRSLGPAVLAFDYRGYGGNAGRPDEDGLYADGEAAWRYLTEELGFEQWKIIIVGRSLGGAVATWLAVRHEPGAVILESTFTSVPDVAAARFPFVPARRLIRARYDNVGRIGKISSPMLIVHSTDDEMISFGHSRRLLAAAPKGTGELVISNDHNQCYVLSDGYVPGLRRFLQAVGVGTQGLATGTSE